MGDCARRRPEPFLRRADWVAGACAGAAALAVYFWTLAPTVTLEDSGELVVAGDYLGVPHPPGYPLWTTLAWFFARLFWFVSYRGQPNPAWAVNALSAACGALAAGTMAVLIARSGRDLAVALFRRMGGGAGGALPSRIAASAGVSASLLFAFSPVMWSQSVIAEVYALNALLLAALLLAAYRWCLRPDDRLLAGMAFLFGLGLTNYQVILLLAGALALLILLRDPALLRDLALVGVALGLLWGLAVVGGTPEVPAYPRGVTPEPGALALLGLGGLCGAMACLLAGRGRALNFLAAALGLVAGAALLQPLLAQPMPVSSAPLEAAAFRAPRMLAAGCGGALLLYLGSVGRGARRFAAATLVLLVPLAVLVYKGALPGVVHPTSGWFWLFVTLQFVLLALARFLLPRGGVTAAAWLLGGLGLAFYGAMPLFSLANPPMNWGYPQTWSGFLHAVSRGQYEPIRPGAIFSLAYLDQLGVYLADLRRQFTLPLAAFGLLPFAAWGVRRAGLAGQAQAYALFLAAAGIALGMAGIGQGGEGRYGAGSLLLGAAVAIAAGGLLLAGVRVVMGHLRLAVGRRAPEARLAATLLPFALVAAYVGLVMVCVGRLRGPDMSPDLASLALILLVVPPLAVGLAAYLLWRVPRLRPAADRALLDWLLASVAGFLVTSLLLVSLANLKSDLQDIFIQRVKFISSHAFFSLWIGYGLIVALVSLARLTRRSAPVRAAAVGVLLLPLVPLRENYHNERLALELGGAEQNGHDFGWQFGAYALDGVVRLRGDLAPDEEPPPNPCHPPPMESDAVFFGGTDPGRFVPTYMIYSADVRPDVYLITQNALADETFMQVTRDLYGDQLWLPTPRESGAAFSEYILERHQANRMGGVALAGDRVHISGAQEVMVVNGKLARMIFDRNRFRHAFYVEESYPIGWMFPFLAPHGLILRLHADELPALAAEAVRDDLDFWDWYTRRLLANPRFLRDTVARKSFSKLRTASAGVYVSRRMLREADQAFAESVALYPASPEGNLKWIGFVLAVQGRFAEALRVLDRFAALDPANAAIPSTRAQLERALGDTGQMRDLRERLLASTVSLKDLADLLDSLAAAKDRETFRRVAETLIEGPGLPDEFLLVIGEKSFAANERATMDRAFRAWLGRVGSQANAGLLRDVADRYARVGDAQGTADVLPLYLALQPADHAAWVHLAVAQIILREHDEAYRSLERAIAAGGEAARKAIRADARLQPALAHPKYRPILDL
jgi:tetratricopeptide (TPR) repeat protein